MMIFLLVSVLGQGSMFGGRPPSPVATVATPPPPAIDATALGTAIGQAVAEKLVERMAADRREILDTLAKNHAAIVKLAAEPPPVATVATTPPPPQRVYVARDAAGFDWEDTDRGRLLDWVEQRNVKTRKASVIRNAVAPAITTPPPVTRTITVPTYTLPAAAPTFDYGVAPDYGSFSASVSTCGPGGCSPGLGLGLFR